MAVIKGALAADGTLTLPSVIIEFQPGDTIEIESVAPVQVLVGNSLAIRVLRSFSPNQISSSLKDGVVVLDLSLDSALAPHSLDIRLPPKGGGGDPL